MKRWYFAVVAFQLLFIAGEAAMYYRQVQGGETILLRVVPVDPRSLFMGNYMALDYDVGSIFVKDFPHARNREPDDVVYVGLRPNDPYASIEDLGPGIPKDRNGLVYLRGRVVYSPDKLRMRVAYGIDRYYIPETKKDDAQAIWERVWQKKSVVTAELSVTPAGRAFIRRILVDGKPLGY